ncbi:MAG: SDR family oxidoreductase [Phycisphaerales bacterium]|nr:MAG: SDR family oxidoreductase [Phycisphaerales bacterium]
MMCSGKVAIVAGAAGKGMGRSIALTLAREGAKVVVNYRTSADSAAAIVAHIERRGGRALAFAADVNDPDQCRALVEAATQTFGQVDICIIGPGAGWHPESIDRLDAAGALDDVQKELAPIYHLMPLVLPGMYERKWGRVIALALTPPYNSPAYAYNVAKAARAAALSIARDAAWSKGVTLNTIGPGPVGEIATLDEAIEQCDHGPAWQQRGTTSPQDVAEGVAFLCSDAGNFISGAVLPYLYRG